MFKKIASIGVIATLMSMFLVTSSNAQVSSACSSIAVFGDSGSTGTGSTGYTRGDYYQRTEHGWWPNMVDQLGLGDNITAFNYARGGAMVSDFIPGNSRGSEFDGTENALSYLDARDPEVTIVELGGNDFLWDRITPTTFMLQLRSLALKIKQVSPNTKLVFVSIWKIDNKQDKVDYPQFNNYPWSGYVDSIKTVARNYNSPVVDLQNYIASSDTDTLGLYDSDLIHLNDLGHAVMMAAVTPTVAARCAES